MSPNAAEHAPAKDPVCGMTVNPASAKDKAEQVIGLIDSLEEMDDVQQVYHSLQLDEVAA